MSVDRQASGLDVRASRPRCSIYVASSWRNEHQPRVVELLRTLGHDVYDFRAPTPESRGFHWSETEGLARPWPPGIFLRALQHPIAARGFASDFAAMGRCDTCVLLLPCGRSAHLEAGFFVGRPDKRLIIALEPGASVEPELMYLMADRIVVGDDQLLEVLA